MRTPTRLLIPAALAVLLAFGGGCSSGGHDDATDDVATLGASTDQGDNSSADDADDSGGGRGGQGIDPEFQDAVLEFAQCMRDHGIDMPDPQITEDGGVLIQAGGPPGDGDASANASTGEAGLSEPSAADQQKMEDAQEACQPIMDDARGSLPEPDPEQQAEMQDQALAFAQCMREHGIDFPDPTFDNDGGRMTVAVGGPDTGDGPHFDPNDEDFQDAAKACDADGAGFGFGAPVQANGSGDDGDDG